MEFIKIYTSITFFVSIWHTPSLGLVAAKNREVHETSAFTPAGNDIDLSDVVLRQENIALRQKFKDMERDKCQLKIDIEELEVKNEALNIKVNSLESDNSRLSIRLEVAKGQIYNQTDKLENKLKK